MANGDKVPSKKLGRKNRSKAEIKGPFTKERPYPNVGKKSEINNRRKIILKPPAKIMP
jgi:hypothetical protein